MITHDYSTRPAHWRTRTTHDPHRPGDVTITPGLSVWMRQEIRLAARRRALRARNAVVRAVSLLGVSWRLTVALPLEAEVTADDQHTARALLEQFLRDAGTRVVVCAPGGIGGPAWRMQGCAPVGDIRGLVAEPDDFYAELSVWTVRAVVEARITLPAHDADTTHSYADLEPCATPPSIPYLQPTTGDGILRRTPVRRPAA